MVTRTIAEKNLEYLESVYGAQDSVRSGTAILNKGIISPEKINLRWTLRDHSFEKNQPIYYSETLKRDAVDDLLSYYGVLEIAIILGVIPKDLNGRLQTQIQFYLGHVDVKRYYTKAYEIFLPTGLYRRMLRAEVNVTGQEQGDEASANIMSLMAFLSLSEEIYEDKEVSKFLWLLDDGIDEQGNNIEDIVAVFETPTSLEKILRKKKATTDLEREVRGFLKFVNLSISLRDFLESYSSKPIIQSAFYHYHRYWYKSIRRNVELLSKGTFKLLASWLSKDNLTLEKKLREDESRLKKLKDDLQKGYETFKIAFADLTGDKYETAYLQYLTTYNSNSIRTPLKVPTIKMGLVRTDTWQNPVNVRDAILSLPEKYREALVLHEFEGFSYEKVGEKTGTSSSTARIRVFRAKKMLSQIISPARRRLNKSIVNKKSRPTKISVLKNASWTLLPTEEKRVTSALRGLGRTNIASSLVSDYDIPTQPVRSSRRKGRIR